MFDHAANVGRERGSESPIPVSPTRATLTGRSACFREGVHRGQLDDSSKRRPRSRIGRAATHSPRRSNRREPISRPSQPRWPTIIRTRPPEPTCKCLPMPPPDRPRGVSCPLLHEAESTDARKDPHIHNHQHGPTMTTTAFPIARGPLESHYNKRRNEVDLKEDGQRYRRTSPTSTSPRTDPTPTAKCDPCRDTKWLAIGSSAFERASMSCRGRFGDPRGQSRLTAMT